ncbi:hypothetical protein B0H65DRAFT_250828 [Neurospora tetraspora]|uniref:Zn(2)-C6 fungal-type domain-containing protein n=1 Tax=Neurospora tetraspora TaxID=94610 RepID=A0AAE0MP13_9PEZI|nr:hypothetical protein B0H65DRAFT_250828 [Neurospora tetraspora]
MVGVPGKYKGCNSCRVRRVKCDNERPYCRKCIDSGRECLGYERETVFIIGTIEDGGRCSSHPPRVIKSKKAKASTSSRSGGEEERGTPQQKHQKHQHYPELFPDQPLQSAWDDLISLSTPSGTKYTLQFTALNTRLQNVLRRSGSRGDATGEFTVNSMAEYEVPNLQLYFSGQDFELKSQCLISLPESQNEDPYMPSIGSCVFLYEHNNSTLYTNLYSNQPSFKDSAAQNDPIRRAGPEKFQTFPNHHFFVRVYRPTAILTALLNRTPTFLESAEWTSTPWEKHPKSILDQLFDIIALLPRILSRTDRVTEEVQTLSRRQRAQDLLTNCLNIERQLNAWSSSFSAEMTAAISRQTTAVITPSSSSTSISDYGQSPPYLTTPPTSSSYPYLSPSSSPYSQGQGQGQTHSHRRSPSNSNSISRSRGTPSPTPSASASASSPRFQPYPTTSPHSHSHHKPQGQPRSPRRASPSSVAHAHPNTGYPSYSAGYPFTNPPLAFPTSQLALAYILYCTSLMQLYQTIERIYWSIFEPLPLHMVGTGLQNMHQNMQNMNLPLEVQMQQMQQMPVDLISDPARYGSKAVRGLAERVGRSLEFALNNNIEPGMLAYPVFVIRAFYESLGLGLGAAAASWEGLGVGVGVGVMGVVDGLGMDMGMTKNMNPGMTVGRIGTMGSHMSYSAGMENLNIMGLDGINNTTTMTGSTGGGQSMGYHPTTTTAPTTTTTTAAAMLMQQQSQAPPPDGRLEVMWCDHFREKLKARGAEISNAITGQGRRRRRWREIAAFGY